MTNNIERISDYKVLRLIGKGGFGDVYLAQDKTNNYVAIKIIKSENASRETNALEKYSNLKSIPNFIEIIESGKIDNSAIFYVMPLADTLESAKEFPPSDFRWQEKSLANIIDAKIDSQNNEWFSRDEILSFILPIFDATIALGESSMLHRDIKPDNILFFNGKPTLSDFGLLENDHRTLSNVGTPLYFAPSWYIAKGGNPDTYGLATTFYSLITGNLPDTIGRPAYRFPEKTTDSISDTDKAQWLHWHRCIMRAIAENPTERFLTIQDFRNAIASTDFSSSLNFATPTKKPNKSLKTTLYTSIAIGCVLIGSISMYFTLQNTTKQVSIENQSTYQPVKKAIFSEEFFKEVSQNGFSNSITKIKIQSFEEWKKSHFDNVQSYKEQFLQQKELAEKSDAQINIEAEKAMQYRREEWQRKEKIHKRNPKLTSNHIEQLKQQFYTTYIYPGIVSIKKEKLYLRKIAKDNLLRYFESYKKMEQHTQTFTTIENYRNYVEKLYSKYLNEKELIDLYKKDTKK